MWHSPAVSTEHVLSHTVIQVGFNWLFALRRAKVAAFESFPFSRQGSRLLIGAAKTVTVLIDIMATCDVEQALIDSVQLPRNG